MIKDTKKLLKMAKYIPGIKSQLIVMITLFSLGVVFEFTGEDHFVLSGMYMLLPCSIFFHIAYTGNVSSMMQTSSLKKYSQTVFPFIFTVPFALIMYSLLVFHRVMLAKNTISDDPAHISGLEANSIILLGMILFVSLIYFSLCFKYFAASLVIFFILVMALVLGNVNDSTILFDYLAGGNFNFAVGLGYILVILGSVVSFILASALYKKDISKLATKSVLRTTYK